MAIFSLCIDEARRFSIESMALAMPSPYTNFEYAFQYVKACHASTANSIFPELFYATPPDTSALLLHELPTDQTASLDAAARHAPGVKHSFVSEFCLLYMSCMFGEPFSYKYEKSGDVVHNIFPTRSGSHSTSNEGSMSELLFHMEIAHLYPSSPDHLCLYCVQSDLLGTAETFVLPYDRLYYALDEKSVYDLQQPIFSISSPYSFKYPEPTTTVRPILVFDDTHNPIFAVNLNAVSGLNPDANDALSMLRTTISNATDIATSVKLRRGDMLLLNNNRALHSRSAFTPTFSPSDRWLQRVYVTRDITAMRRALPHDGRVFTL
jgi:L-asparagine oxygenase